MNLTRTKRIDRTGFTLIEMLLGLSIFSIITLTAYSVFYSGIRLSRGSQRQGQIIRETRWMLDIMQKEFANMLFYDFSNSYDNKTALSGTSSSLSFVQGSDDGLKVVKYFIVFDNSNCLIREELSFVDYLAGNSSESKFEIILKNIKENGVRFFYGYFKEELSDEIIWKENWNNNYLASMIRVEVDLVTGQDNKTVVTLFNDIFIPIGNKRKYESE